MLVLLRYAAIVLLAAGMLRGSDPRVILILKAQPERAMIREAQMLYAPVVPSDHAEMGARTAIARRIEQTFGSGQQQLITRLYGLGATNVSAFRAFNAVAANVPAEALSLLERDEAVAAIVPDSQMKAKLDVSAIALGAPAFWDVGMTGTGQSIALIDSGVDTSHPAFFGAHIVRGPVFSAGWYPGHSDHPDSPDDFTWLGHGTQMAGILAGQGSPGYTRHLGIARGATIYSLKAAYATESNGLRRTFMTTSDFLAALDYAVLNTPAKIINMSHGAAVCGEGCYQSYDSSPLTLLVEQIIRNYDIALVVSGGLVEPGNAWNSIAVGAMNDKNTPTRADDEPLPGNVTNSPWPGSHKPDLTAPGFAVLAPTGNWEGFLPDYRSMEEVTWAYGSSSAAAAHVSGALALIRQSGITNMLAAKAVLINSAEGPGWTPLLGFGYLNLWNAKNRGDTFSSDDWQQTIPRYLAGPVDSGPLQITFATRRTEPLAQPRLQIYDRRTHNSVFRTQTQNTAEKVHLANGYYLIVVEPGGQNEDWALALSRRGFRTVYAAQSKAECRGDATARLGSKHIVTCTVINPGEIELPARAEIYDAGTCSIDFGWIAPRATRTASCALTLNQPGPAKVCSYFWRFSAYGFDPLFEPLRSCYTVQVSSNP